jgi:hypothetical protein
MTKKIQTEMSLINIKTNSTLFGIQITIYNLANLNPTLPIKLNLIIILVNMKENQMVSAKLEVA